MNCDRLLLKNEERICCACWEKVTKISPADPTWKEILERFLAEGVVNDILSCYLFEKEGVFQKVIHLLKYQGMKSIGVDLGCNIGKRMIECSYYSSADYLIPVPLHRLKARERGYNQSEYLCRGISQITGIPIGPGIIKRKKYTQSQTTLTIEERKLNVGGAFFLDPKYIPAVKGKTFILVDDVITTGSTINACARELRSHGAQEVYAASAALAE